MKLDHGSSGSSGLATSFNFQDFVDTGLDTYVYISQMYSGDAIGYVNSQYGKGAGGLRPLYVRNN